MNQKMYLRLKRKGVLSHVQNGPDPKNILQCALTEAAQAAGAAFSVEDDVIYLDA